MVGIIDCGNTQASGLLPYLLNEVTTRRDIEGRPYAFVEVALQHDQAVDRLAAASVDLDHEVLLIASVVPRAKHLALHITEVAVTSCLVRKRLIQLPWLDRSRGILLG